MNVVKWTTMIALLLGLLAGCSGNSTGTTQPSASDSTKKETTAPSADSTKAPENAVEKAPQDYKGEITIWSWYGDWSKEYIKLFNKTYPNIKVNLSTYSGADYFTKLYNALQGGSGAPDVIEIEEGQIAKLVNSGQLEELANAKYPADTNLFFKSQVDSFTDKNGKIVGLPESSNPAGIWYNRKVVKEYLGTDDPAEVEKLIGSGENSYDKLINAMQTVLDKSGGKVKGVGSLEDMLGMFNMQKSNKKFEGDKIVYDKIFKDDYNLLAQMAQKKLSANLKPYDQPWMQTFLNDTVAFYPGAVWFLGYTIPKDDKQKGKWAFIPSPGPGWTSGDQASAIWKGSKNKELAWLWVKWFTMTKEAQMLQYDLGLLPSGLKDLFKDPKFTQVDPFLNQSIGPVFDQILSSAVVKEHTTNDSAITDTSQNVLKEMETGKLDGAQGLEKVVTESLKRLKGIKR